MRRILTWSAALAVALGVIVPISQTTTAQPAAALSGSDFDNGYIIADWLFYDGGAMSSAEIQSFLESKVSSCPSGSTCLRNGIVNPPSYPLSRSSSTGNVICNAVTGGSMRVSEWIYRVQVACGISAKVILVTLQKEQGLITSSNPGTWAMQAAMGMACPDTAPCDSAYAGFATQVYYGTRQLMNYKAGRFGKLPGANYIGFHPNGACGGTTLNIRNWATAALYTYTPYQPNGAALANLGGTGDSCSSYGNRNFWRYYATWFGDPRGGDPDWVEAAFHDLLGHTSGGAVHSPQNNALIAGWTRSAVATSIITGDEYRIRVILQTYLRILGRPADNAGLNWWLAQTQAGNVLVSQIGGRFLVSDELYLRAGNTPEGWVSLVYETVLGRAPDPSGLVAWSNILRSAGRSAVYDAIYNSQESVTRRVDYLYQTYLGHTADPGAISYFTPSLMAGGDEAVAAQVIGSTEYSLRSSLRFPGGSASGAANPPANQAPQPVEVSAAVSSSNPSFLRAIGTDLLGSAPSAGAIGSWDASLGAGMTRTWVAANITQSAAYRAAAVDAAYQNALGRAADSGGRAYWIGQTAPGGTTLPSAFLNTLLASDEAVLRFGNSTAGWVSGVSQTLLGRAPTSTEAGTWASLAASSGRDAMVASIYNSTESLDRRLAAITQALLGRTPMAVDTSRYRNTLRTHGDEHVKAQIGGSAEYDARAQTRFASPFLRAVGTDILGSDPAAVYIAGWSGMMASGTTHYALASLLYSSAEYRTLEITKAYQSMLGRAPDSAGLSYWLGRVAEGGVRASTMEEQFLLSDELYIRAGNTPQGWVTSLFQTELGRTPDAAGLAYWSSQVNVEGRAAVMWGIYNSPESAILRLNALTTKLLGRGVTNEDIIGLGPLMVSGGEEAVGAAIIGSRDYDQQAARRFPIP